MNKWEVEVQQSLLDSEKAAIKELEKQYAAALKDINAKVRMFQADIDLLDQALNQDGLDEATKSALLSQKRSKVYQQQYQQALKNQIGGIIDKLHSDSYATIDQYLKQCYEDGYIGTMYDIAKQGIPIIAPIDQAAMVRAILTDSKIVEGYYKRLGVNYAKLKKVITQEVSRGIATSLPYADIARNINNASNSGLYNAKRIARTEGHRIQQTSTRDAQRVAKRRGADVLKQWDATLDGRTRPSHARIDGEIRETDEEYSNGLMFPGDPSGAAAEVINCRCVSKTRARWALDTDELQKLQDRANFFGLDKTKGFDSFKAKYLEAVKNESSLLYHEGERITKSKEYAVVSKIIQSRTYAEKFDHMASSPHERREYLRAAKEMLHHRSGQNGEDLYLYNRLNGKWVKSTAGNEAGTPEYTEAIIDAISKSRPGQLVAFHNHPASMPPSDSDLNAALQNGYSVGYILCHDGKIFEYTQPERPIRSTAYDLIIANFKEKGYSEYDAQIETLRALSAEYGFDFKEVK